MDKTDFKEKISQPQALGDAGFADAVYTAISSFGVSEQAFRSTFGLSQGTVERWTQMRNLPQPIVRPKILDWIKEQIT